VRIVVGAGVVDGDAGLISRVGGGEEVLVGVIVKVGINTCGISSSAVGVQIAGRLTTGLVVAVGTSSICCSKSEPFTHDARNGRRRSEIEKFFIIFTTIGRLTVSCCEIPRDSLCAPRAASP